MQKKYQEWCFSTSLPTVLCSAICISFLPKNAFRHHKQYYVCSSWAAFFPHAPLFCLEECFPDREILSLVITVQLGGFAQQA